MRYTILILFTFILNSCFITRGIGDDIVASSNYDKSQSIIDDIVRLKLDSNIEMIDISKFIDHINLKYENKYERFKIAHADSLIDSTSLHFQDAYIKFKIDSSKYINIKATLLQQNVHRLYLTSDYIYFVQSSFLGSEWGFLYCLNDKRPKNGERHIGRYRTRFASVENYDRWYRFDID